MIRRLSLLVVLLAGACSAPPAENVNRRLNRPSDVAFACIGTVTEAGGSVTRSFTPATCSGVLTGDAGVSVTQLVVIPEATQGDVAIGLASAQQGGLLDSDRFTPGENGLATGRLPVGAAVTPDGCYAVTANAGSCDLGVIDVARAAVSAPNVVRRVALSSSLGPLAASPAAVITRPSLPASPTPSMCTAPSDVAYLAFPACDLVARVDLATGQVLDGVRFPAGSPPQLTGPDVTCPAECDDGAAGSGAALAALPWAPAALGGETLTASAGAAGGAGGVEPSGTLAHDGGHDAAVVDAGAPDAAPATPAGSGRPVALALEPDGSRLYVALAGRPELVVVPLDAAGAMVEVLTKQLPDAGGILRLAASGPVEMGTNGVAGLHHFVYALARDRSIRVIDVTPTRAMRECDTQIDRRFLRDETSVALLACAEVGATGTPPRRPGAVGPGIRLPDGVLPLDLSIFRSNVPFGAANQPVPETLNGTFAAVTALGPVSTPPRGLVYIVNIDDENMEDVEPGTPADVELAIAHSVRDGVGSRRPAVDPCVEPAFTSALAGPVRIAAEPGVTQGFVVNTTGVEGDPFAPMLHRILCDADSPVYPLSVAAPREVRQVAFPDLGQVSANETISVTWEGPLAFETASSQRTGAAVEVRTVASLELSAPGALLCGLGVQPRDFVRLLGCTVESDCQEGEVCFLHPNAPSGVTGMCFPREQADVLGARCRDVLTSLRHYTVVQASTDGALVVPRPDVLTFSPVDGCIDDAQCAQVEDFERRSTATARGVPLETLPVRTSTCAADPAMGGPPRCVLTCDADDDCHAGSVCEAGRCVTGPIPGPECFAALQRYEFRGGDVFTVLSSEASLRHRVVVNPADGTCVEDPSLGPLLTGRFHRDARVPACTGTGVEDVGPNPCILGGAREPVKTAAGGIAERDAHVVRLRTPGLTLDVTDVSIPIPTIPGARYSPIPMGYTVQFQIGGGSFPFFDTQLGASLPGRVRTSLDGSSFWVVDHGDRFGNSTLDVIAGQVILVIPTVSPFGHLRLN